MQVIILKAEAFFAFLLGIAHMTALLLYQIMLVIYFGILNTYGRSLMKGTFLQVNADSRAQMHSLTCMEGSNKIKRCKMENNSAGSAYHVRAPACMATSMCMEELHQHLKYCQSKADFEQVLDLLAILRLQLILRCSLECRLQELDVGTWREAAISHIPLS